MKQKEFYKYNSEPIPDFYLPQKYEKVVDLIQNKGPRKFLDLGCGDGFFSVLVKNKIKTVETFGVDIQDEAIKKAQEKGINAFSINMDEQDLPFSDEFFDVIFCGELIEHLFDPDHLLMEIHRLLKSDGLCILTTPNLSSWFNRIALLCGYQPFFTEVSTKYGVGHMFPFWLNAGHIRLFTYKALRDLIKIYNFEIIKVYGFGINTKIGLGKKLLFLAILANAFSYFFPSLASDLAIIIKKRK